MNVGQIVSIAVKGLLAVSGVLVALKIMTPDQVAELQAALGGLEGAIATLVSAGVAIYSVIRSVRTHKEDGK